MRPPSSLALASPQGGRAGQGTVPADCSSPASDCGVLVAGQVATVAGFGPRFLHSTGQAYKGGPAGGAFLTITRDPVPHLPIPGHRTSFGTIQIAQARGDMVVLASRDRPVLRIHLKDNGGGIEALRVAVLAALLDS